MEPTTSSAKGNSPSTTFPASELRLVVAGIPGPKGSRNVRPDGGTYEQSKVGRTWVKLVAKACAIPVPLAPPYEVAISFAMPTPATPTFAWPVRGDLDKLVRATLDGLQQAGVITEDKHVVALASDKRFARSPGAVIHVRSLGAA